MDKTCISPDDRNEKFLRKLKARNIDVQACYQCGRCSSGCPIGDFFDLNVMEVVRLAGYGQEEKLLHSHTIWLCAACETCATRCPNEIEIAGLMDVLRELALRRGIAPAEPRIPLFHQSFLGSIRSWGRAWEIGMIAQLQGEVRGSGWRYAPRSQYVFERQTETYAAFDQRQVGNQRNFFREGKGV